MLNSTQSHDLIPNPTLATKGIDNPTRNAVTTSNVEEFKNMIYTGFEVRINTPLVKNDRSGLLAINLDGFIPAFSYNDNYFRSTLKNLCPVQTLIPISGIGANNVVEIRQEMIQLAVQHLYLSHRFVMGSVGVGIRVASNTSQSGNLLITNVAGVQRQFYPNTESYTKLRLTNTSTYATDYAQNSYIVSDLSLNRQVSLIAPRNDPTKRMDLHKKILETQSILIQTTFDNIWHNNVVSSQFLEDWLIISPLTTLPDQNANQIILNIFFDYSKIFFLQNLFPMYPTIPSDGNKQILLVTETLKLPTISKVNAKFVGTSSLLDTLSEKIKNTKIKCDDHSSSKALL